MASEERLRELEEKYEGYTVYDNQGSKIGKVDDLFVDEKDHEEYIGVKLGFLGRKSTLIPTEIVRVNENDRTIEVSESKDHVKNAPSFDDDEDVTSGYEERIRRHFGLESLQQSGSGGSYGSATGTAAGGAAGGAAGSTAAGFPDHAEGQSSGSSEYASDGGERESSGQTHPDDGETSSGTGFGSTTSGQETPGGSSPEESSSSGTGYYEQSGGQGDTTGEQRETSGSSGMIGRSGESSSGASGSQPATTRQTEETETFQEGGKTKIRRRVIREEVVDADDQGSGS